MSYLLSYVLEVSELVLQVQPTHGNSASQEKRLKASHRQHFLLLSDCLCLVGHSSGLVSHILEGISPVTLLHASKLDSFAPREQSLYYCVGSK